MGSETICFKIVKNSIRDFWKSQKSLITSISNRLHGYDKPVTLNSRGMLLVLTEYRFEHPGEQKTEHTADREGNEPG